MCGLSKGAATELSLEQNAEKMEEARQTMNRYGYFPVENDVISAVQMENAIGAVSQYLRQLPKRMYVENTTRRWEKK